MKSNNRPILQLVKRIFAIQFLFSLLLLASAHPASAQYFPTFVGFNPNYSFGTIGTVGIASAPALTQSSEVVAVYSQGNNILSAYSLDGLSYTNSSSLPFYGMLGSPTLMYFNGALYCAFYDSEGQLLVAKGTLSTETNDYTWAQAYIQESIDGGVVVSPQMVIFQNTLHIIYGVKSINGITNALVDTYTTDGVNYTATSAGLGDLTYAAPTQVGLSELNGVLHMTTQQNNSHRNLYYWYSNDGFTWYGGEDTALQTDSGLSMVTYNNNLVFATKQNNNDNNLFLFSSPDGSTWYASNDGYKIYPNTTPAMCLFTNSSGVSGIALVTVTFNQYFVGAFASS